MTETPKFLKEVSKDSITKDALDQLNNLTTKYLSYEEDIASAELVLKELKSEFNKISQERIPELLATYGLSEIKLATGEKVIVSENASVSVPDEKKEAFYLFLKDRDEEDIIKVHLHFDRMANEKIVGLFTFLTEGEYVYGSDRGVHSQTLKKYFKELLGIGVDKEEYAMGVSDGVFLRN